MALTSAAICKSAPRSRQITTQFFTGRMLLLPPNQQRQSTEGIIIHAHTANRWSLSMWTWATSLVAKCYCDFQLLPIPKESLGNKYCESKKQDTTLLPETLPFFKNASNSWKKIGEGRHIKTCLKLETYATYIHTSKFRWSLLWHLWDRVKSSVLCLLIRP